MVYDVSDGYVLLYGGFDNQLLGDTWVYQDGTWTQEFPSVSPGPMAYAAMAYDPVDGYVVLFGGETSDSVLGNTWTYHAGAWTELATPTAPPARAYAQLAFDPTSQRLILFGGLTYGFSLYSDTWAFRGGQWTQLSPTQSPSSRAVGMVSTDTESESIVLFGGCGAFQSDGVCIDFLNDTWQFQGNNWSPVESSTSPTARADASFAYDADSQELVLFGGNGAPGYFADTWTFASGQWTELSLSVSPSQRNGAPAAMDGSGGILLFGGGYAGTYPTDTWVFGAGGVLGYAVTFLEAGLSPGTLWSVTFAGVAQSSTGQQDSFNEPDGVYAYVVAPSSSFVPVPSAGSVTVAGLPQAVSITFGEASQSESSVTILPAGSTLPCVGETYTSSSTHQDLGSIPLGPGPASAYPNDYGTATSSTGSTTMCYATGSPDSLSTTVSFTNAILSGNGVLGYPDVSYGPNPWSAGASTPDETLPLPMSINDLTNIWGTSDYSVNDQTGVPSDFVYDIWVVNPSDFTPGDGPGNGYVEVMVWLSTGPSPSEIPPIGSSPFESPGSLVPAQLQTEIVGNGVSGTATWNVYWGDRSQPGGSTGTTISYVLSQPVSQGVVSVPLGALISDVSDFYSCFAGIPSCVFGSSAAYGSDDLEQISIGSEYKDVTGSSGPVSYGFDIYAFCLFNFGFADPANLVSSTSCPRGFASSSSPPLPVEDIFVIGGVAAAAPAVGVAVWMRPKGPRLGSGDG